MKYSTLVTLTFVLKTLGIFYLCEQVDELNIYSDTVNRFNALQWFVVECCSGLLLSVAYVATSLSQLSVTHSEAVI